MAGARRWENPFPLQRELLGRLQDSAWVEALSPQVTKPSRTTFPPEAALGTPRRDVPSERGREERSASSLRVESSLLLRKRVSARGPHGKKRHCPGVGASPTVTAAVCSPALDGRGGRPAAGPLSALTAQQQAGGRLGGKAVGRRGPSIRHRNFEGLRRQTKP